MNRSFSMLAGCLVVLTFASASVLADDSDAKTQPKSTWVTSIAQLGTSSEFVAATADGLLLREASVVSFQAADPDTLKPLYTHPAAVWCVASLSDGSKVASVDYRGNLMVFDVKEGKASSYEKAFERWCQAMLISSDDKLIVAGNEAGKVMIWDIAAGKVSKSVELEGHAVTGLAISPDHTQLAASDGAGHLHLLKFPELESIANIKISDETAWCVAYANDGQHLFVGSSDRNLYRCEAKAEAKPESVAKGTDWITQLAVSPGGQVAAAEVGGKLHFPSLGGTDSMDAKSGVWSLCWNGDEQLFAGTRKDGVVIAGRSWKWADSQAKRAADAAKKAEQEQMKVAAAKKAAEEEALAEAAKKAEEEKMKAEAAKKAEAEKKAAEEKAAAEKKAADAAKAAEEAKAAEANKAAEAEKAAEQKGAAEAQETSEKKE